MATCGLARAGVVRWAVHSNSRSMEHVFYLVPVFETTDPTAIASALVGVFAAHGTRACTFQPIERFPPEHSSVDARITNVPGSALPGSLEEAGQIVATQGWDGWLTGIVERLQSSAHGFDVLVVAAPAPSADHPFVSLFNRKLIRALDAEIILLADLARPMDQAWGQQIALAARLYADGNGSRVVGCILDRLRPHQGEPVDSASARIRKEYSALGPPLPELVALVPEPGTLPPSSESGLDDPTAARDLTHGAASGFVARYLDGDWIDQRCAHARERRISPAAFYARITRQARDANRRVILPESTDPRIIRAAAVCAQRSIARCVLLGDPDAIKRVAREQAIELPAAVEIMDADAIRADHVEALIRLRGPGQLSPREAAQQLQDDGLLATVLLALGQVDGLVSGAVHSSAATVRAALQIVKTRPGVKRASSIFFMCLPDQVLVYGDCAVNPDPDAETLAGIAVQSADSAVHFGLPARVALLSYATEKSGSGPDVDKVRTAVRLAQSKRPDLLIDGPLQYDAAAVADVARRKAPDSPVAGRATVYIFSDLDTGNITYKAVQHSAGIVCIGPLLQGLQRPVSDLSRGASVEDIVYTVAAVAVQATQA